MSKSVIYGLYAICAVVCVVVMPLACLAEPRANGKAEIGDGGGNQSGVPEPAKHLAPATTPEETIARRLKRQRRIIDNRLQNGNLTEDQAQKLNQSVNEIETNFKELGGDAGALKPEDAKRLINSLNQNANELRSTAVSGASTVQGENALGPQWSKGPDGAQNPRTLLKEMKAEHRREMRQERQSNEQKLEMQQQDYEREMVESLGEQREKILEKKEQLKEVRDESGAN